MSLSKIFTAIKGGFSEATEAVADGQSIRILDQELREAKQELKSCDQSLTTIMAKRKLVENKLKSIEDSIATYTQHAIGASESGNEELALECAEKVGDLESEAETERTILQGFRQSEKTLKENISKAKVNVRRMEQQIDQVKATESVQKAQVAVSSRHTGANSKVKTALDSLERIKAKQQQKAAELEAAEEMAAEESGSDLDAKLKAAGIAPGGSVSGRSKLDQILAAKQA